MTTDDRPEGYDQMASFVLAGLQKKHIYSGTVTPQTKAQRRKKNKAARIARREQRR